MMSQTKITNLSYLRDATENDKEAMSEIIKLFIAQIPEFIEQMNAFYKSKHYSDLGKVAHKAKSSVMVMGLNDLGAQLKELQLLTERGTEIERYPLYINNFTQTCKQAQKELEEFIKK